MPAVRHRMESLGPRAVLVVAGVTAGILLRVEVLRSDLGALDSDEAVVGLMALHVLDGEFSVFYWLQAYTGFQAPVLLAPILAVVGPHALVLKLFTVLLYGVAGVLVWFVGRRTVGHDAAWLGALLFWIWPPFFVWWSTRTYLYEQFLILGLAALLLALRLEARVTRLDAILLGAVLGLGWWASPQVFVLALPAVVWLVARRPEVVRLAHLVAVPALVASSPWWVWNARNDWLSLRLEPEVGATSSLFERLETLVSAIIPTWLAVRTPFSLDWTFGPVVGATVSVAAVGYVAWLFYQRSRRLEPLLVVLAFFPILYLTSSFTYYAEAPKYLVVLAPVPALLLGRVLQGGARAPLALAAAVVVSFVGLKRMEDDTPPPMAIEGGVPADISPLLSLLERNGVNRVFATYWLAYRITFESDEQIIATSTTFVRYQPHDRLVRRAARPAWVFLPRAENEPRAGMRLLARGYRRRVLDRFVVYLPPRS